MHGRVYEFPNRWGLGEGGGVLLQNVRLRQETIQPPPPHPLHQKKKYYNWDRPIYYVINIIIVLGHSGKTYAYMEYT